MKLCIDCRYMEVVRNWDVRFAGCLHFSATVQLPTSPVDGKVPPSHQRNCDSQRAAWGACGPDGRFFEPKAGAISASDEGFV